ncbi:aldehyde dehydrogenase family protein [Agriterribacter sp.]|uniref:aldehyde dehydrogenase family protein n=1 Tax=Agriterribacter sp. TaxID=2821509 RepID=UPI002CE9CA39|nr:aldehyde dehydrogenase family protein [Agriterribacter sp.]HRP55105.1 aldehyde dehydrogenase family protein [Agriterribacter sp.]
MASTVVLQSIRAFYNSGATRSYAFRKQQLKKLRQALLQHEEEIYKALYADLKKSREEAYLTELGLMLAEIRIMLKNLRQWMKPQPVATNLFNFASSSTIYRDPLGVVLVIAPWNFPLQLALMAAAGAIAGGNCVVIKPSELAPATAVLLQKIITAIFPPEYVYVAQGAGAEVVTEMMQSFRFDHIFFTGSPGVGGAIYALAAQKLVPVTLELGGKNPAIVEADADIDIAAKRIAVGKYTNSGQVCIAPDYVLVHASVKERLLKALTKAIKNFYGDDPVNSYDYGKIINRKRFDTLINYLRQGNIVAGGKYKADALFLEPTIMDGVSLESDLMKEEIFGPVLPVIPFETMEEALSVIAINPDPLALYLFTASSKKEQRWISTVPFGGGCINNTLVHFSNPALPFGGLGNSGMGSYHGEYSFKLFTRPKAVLKSPAWFDLSIKYPSFRGKLKMIKMILR